MLLFGEARKLCSSAKNGVKQNYAVRVATIAQLGFKMILAMKLCKQPGVRAEHD
jgi:hypothetical protein